MGLGKNIYVAKDDWKSSVLSLRQQVLSTGTQVCVMCAVNKFVNEDRLPHLLLYGPPGTGKTSTILAVAHQIYSPKEFNSMVLEV